MKEASVKPADVSAQLDGTNALAQKQGPTGRQGKRVNSSTFGFNL